MLPSKGLAMAYPSYTQDITSLNTSWWYVWSVQTKYLNDPTYVPMLRKGTETNLPLGYSGYCILFNEPEFKEPNGINISVDEMVKRYKEVILKYPLTKFIVGGTAYLSYNRMKNFRSKLIKQKLPIPELWHVHCYVDRKNKLTTSVIKKYLAQYKNLGGKIWITEYGVPKLDKYTLTDFKSLTDYFIANSSWIERFAAYTNRQLGLQAAEIGIGCNLCTDTGVLNSIGEYYSSI
jgi:hypothetical protein